MSLHDLIVTETLLLPSFTKTDGRVILKHTGLKEQAGVPRFDGTHNCCHHCSQMTHLCVYIISGGHSHSQYVMLQNKLFLWQQSLVHNHKF